MQECAKLFSLLLSTRIAFCLQKVDTRATEGAVRLERGHVRNLQVFVFWFGFLFQVLFERATEI